MPEEILENDTPTNEGDQDTNLGNEPDETVEEETVKKEAYENQKVRAEKAEKEIKDLKAKLSENGEPKTPKSDGKKESSEPDYAKLAFLKSEGVTHPDDQKVVQDEAVRLKLPLTDVLQMDHIKGKLKNNNDQREAESGMPKGKGKSGQSSQQDVDYWLAKGETPEDLDLAEKVINARLKKENDSGMFSDELYKG